MTNENKDKQKVGTGSAQQHQPQTVQQAGQQKQASPHDEKSCTNPNHSHGKDNMASGANKPNQNSKAAR